MRGVKQGFTMIELLIVIAIIGILAVVVIAAVTTTRGKAYDTAIRNDVSQFRWLAESVYDSQAASYENWSQHPTVTSEVATLKADIDKNGVGTNLAVIRESQTKEYCISAPLRSDPTHFFCLDATAVLKTVTVACPDEPIDGDPLRCP